ncbi:GDSL-type esterase/lipase family protein [Bacteroides sp. 224]|uniref:GDSL-type esterase/lipase family protein n=1 Tax=Bacteroides sp. 224 TaxID=2302936 RepID=UPI0013D2F484|nr:GDSL-type esterase/lipase family protein [Bacteroides sp. 224]NDV66619.1 capsular biosynthesis protein [Bacteroides sp. 224]
MKSLLLLFTFSFFSLGIFGQNLNLTHAANYKRYAADNAKEHKKVVFIGNSITEGWVRVNPDFFAANNYIGRGIGGQTSPQLLLRFRQDVLNLHPKAVVINIGINDIAENTGEYNMQYTLDCIQSMAELADYNGIKVILSSVLPAIEFGWRKDVTDVPQKVDALNAKIKAYSEEKGFAYIDYNTPMRDENGGLIKEYGRDTVHPNKEGYNVMEKIANEVVRKVIAY